MIKRPLISEKSMGLSKMGVYTFLVSDGVNKHEIAKLIAEKFSVDVVSVKTITIKGKTKVQRSRKGYYQTEGIKKAVVTVKKGQKITLFETANNKEEEEVRIRTAEGEDITTIKEKKSLLKGTKVKVEKIKEESKQDMEEKDKKVRTRQQSGKTKGEE